MTFISYIFSFIATILGLCEPFGKSMRNILIFNFLGNLFVGLSYFLISGFSGAVICFVACVQVVINYVFDSKKKKIPKWLIAVYAIAFVSVNLISFKAWYDVLSLLAALLFVFSVSQSSAKCYRILYASNSAVWIMYDLMACAYGNFLTHVALFVATTLAMVVRDIKLKSQQ